MILNRSYQVRQCTVTQTNPVTVVAPIDCNFISLRNAGPCPVKLVTDPEDVAAWDDLKPGVSVVIDAMKVVFTTVAAGSTATGTPRFSKGTTICILKLNDGDTQQGDIRVGFVL